MTPCTRLLYTVLALTDMLLTLLVDGIRFLHLCLRPAPVLAAENLFLRKQLTLYQEHHVQPRRATDATRCALVRLARWFDWRQALAVVQPATVIRWHRQGVRLFWRWQSRPDRPRIPRELLLAQSTFVSSRADGSRRSPHYYSNLIPAVIHRHSGARYPPDR